MKNFYSQIKACCIEFVCAKHGCLLVYVIKVNYFLESESLLWVGVTSLTTSKLQGGCS